MLRNMVLPPPPSGGSVMYSIEPIGGWASQVTSVCQPSPATFLLASSALIWRISGSSPAPYNSFIAIAARSPAALAFALAAWMGCECSLPNMRPKRLWSSSDNCWSRK
ncbi:hypothetical protein D9M71_700000 [compost metagenome]